MSPLFQLLIKASDQYGSGDLNGITTHERKKKVFFTFKHIGQVIQDLLDDFYMYHFNDKPFSEISPAQAESILRNTVYL